MLTFESDSIAGATAIVEKLGVSSSSDLYIQKVADLILFL